MAEESGMPMHGDLCWSEIASNDLAACKSFYSNVFGWAMQESPNAEGAFEYAEFSYLPGEYPAGGIYQLSKEKFGEFPPPPHYLSYASVDNVDETSAKALELGGKIIRPPMDIPKVGRISVVEDPTGAMIAFVTLIPGGENHG